MAEATVQQCDHEAEMGIRARLFVAVFCAGVSALLPLYILVMGTPISDPDVAVLAQLHSRPDFWGRAALTFVYFPAVIILHFAIQPESGFRRFLYICGFFLFLAGNAIDLPFRAVQYLTVHGHWAPAFLAAENPLVRVQLAEQIQGFSEIAPAISFSFSLLFALGRLAMGAALCLTGSWPLRLAGGALLLNGFWNALPVLGQIPAFSRFSELSDWYLWPWLFSLTALGIAAALSAFEGRSVKAGMVGNEA